LIEGTFRFRFGAPWLKKPSKLLIDSAILLSLGLTKAFQINLSAKSLTSKTKMGNFAKEI
jgi:hypothetical protein